MRIHKNFTCGHDVVNLMRDKKYDAYSCKECDVWIEKACKDPDCEYCPMRPERPSMVAE